MLKILVFAKDMLASARLGGGLGVGGYISWGWVCVGACLLAVGAFSGGLWSSWVYSSCSMRLAGSLGLLRVAYAQGGYIRCGGVLGAYYLVGA